LPLQCVGVGYLVFGVSSETVTALVGWGVWLLGHVRRFVCRYRAEMNADPESQCPALPVMVGVGCYWRPLFCRLAFWCDLLCWCWYGQVVLWEEIHRVKVKAICQTGGWRDFSCSISMYPPHLPCLPIFFPGLVGQGNKPLQFSFRAWGEAWFGCVVCVVAVCAEGQLQIKLG